MPLGLLVSCGRFFADIFLRNDFMTQKRRDSVVRLTPTCPVGASIPSAGKFLCTAQISALALINRVRSEETMKGMLSLFCPVHQHVNFFVISAQIGACSRFWQEPVRFQPSHKPFATNCAVSGDYSKDETSQKNSSCFLLSFSLANSTVLHIIAGLFLISF